MCRKVAVWDWLSLLCVAVASVAMDCTPKTDTPATSPFDALEAAIEAKMIKNAARPFMHGKKA